MLDVDDVVAAFPDVRVDAAFPDVRVDASHHVLPPADPDATQILILTALEKLLNYRTVGKGATDPIISRGSVAGPSSVCPFPSSMWHMYQALIHAT